MQCMIPTCTRLGKALALLAITALTASHALAETKTYYLNQSNIASLPDGDNYLQLSISSMVAGTASFSLAPVYSFAQDTNFGITSFGFNFAGANINALAGTNFQGLAANWTVDTPPASAQDGFGKFDFVVETNNNRLPQLNFTITGLGGASSSDTLAQFAKLSSGNAGQGNFYFAAHLAGFQSGNDSSAFFAGSTLAPIPEPESYAMFLAGLGLLGAAARKRRV